MARGELEEASGVLEAAIDAVDDEDVRDRLRTQAEQLARLAERDQGPDHGRLDRHQHALREIKESVGGIADEVDRANELINAYRETLEGV